MKGAVTKAMLGASSCTEKALPHTLRGHSAEITAMAEGR